MPVPASYNDITEDEQLREHYGWVFYQRNVSVPAIYRSQRVMLRMEAVTHKAKVYWNDQFICEHKGGFLPFEAEITPYIKDGENRLTIAVDNRIDRTTLPVGGDAPMHAQGENTVQKHNYPDLTFLITAVLPAR